MLHNQRHSVRVLFRVPPVPARLQVADFQPILLAEMDAGDGICDLSRDEFAPAQRGFMVEQDAAAGKDAVRFAIVHRSPMGE